MQPNSIISAERQANSPAQMPFGAPISGNQRQIVRLLPVASAARLPLWIVIILAIAYVLPGMSGFGPWKPDEPYVFGIVHSMMQTGDWVVPTLAGEPFMEKPPLYMWVAAITATLSSPWLSADHGARLAIGAFMLVTLIAIGLATRRWYGRGSGRFAVLALLGSLGLAQHGHMMIPDLPLLAGFAVALLGFAWIDERPVKGGVLLGTGIGIAFMAKGLLGPGVLGLAALLLPVLFRGKRNRGYVQALSIAAIAGLPWLLIWPTALYLRSTDLFVEWFWMNNVGRFLGFSVPVLGAAHDPGHLQTTVPWFTFPALPLAAWALWKQRGSILQHEGSQVCLTVFACMLAALSMSASGRVVYLLPLLAPLAILAAPAFSKSMLPKRIDMYGDWTARILFGGLAALVWGVMLWFAFSGQPPAWPLLARHLPMDFPFVLPTAALAAAMLLLAAWMMLLPRLRRFRGRSIVSWTSGLTLLWGTVFALMLPWIDAAKSYQATFREVQLALPTDIGCLASRGLGESERGMLHYVTGVLPQRVEVFPEQSCDVLLHQGLADEPPSHLAREGWHLIWEGARPGERRERFWLFYKADDVASGTTAGKAGDAKIRPVGGA